MRFARIDFIHIFVYLYIFTSYVMKGDVVDAVACFEPLTTQPMPNWPSSSQIFWCLSKLFVFLICSTASFKRSSPLFQCLWSLFNVFNILVQKFISTFSIPLNTATNSFKSSSPLFQCCSTLFNLLNILIQTLISPFQMFVTYSLKIWIHLFNVYSSIL